MKSGAAKFMGKVRSWLDTSETATKELAENLGKMSKFAKVAQVALFPLSRCLRGPLRAADVRVGSDTG